MSDIWFKLNYRENVNEKYEIVVYQCGQDTNSLSIDIAPYRDDKILGDFKFRISHFWLFTNFNVSENRASYLHRKARKLIENMIRDMLFEEKIAGVLGRTIDFQDLKENYRSRIFKNDNGELDYRREARIIAAENKIARQIVLEQLFLFQNQVGGPVDRSLLKERCAYYPNTVTNAITTLKSKGFIEDYDGYHLTYPGSMYIEERILSPFKNKIFLIAACNDIVYRLIDKVYRPAVKELGYTLIFQEQSEPKGSIHEDIWNYINHCRIILCDLSYKRPNCFIEYGYALAKEKHIILCVEENEGKTKDGYIRVPFDTQNQKYSFWKKEWFDNGEESELEKYKNEIQERVQMKIQIIELEEEII